MSDAPIEARAWRQFLALAETLHYGRAAARLHMTQPPLTVAIQQLEARLGTPLFLRSRRSVALSPAGEALVEPVRQWLAAGQDLVERARASGRGELGRLRLGFVSTLGFGPLPAWLRSFRAAHPGLQVELREATGDVQQAALREGQLDCGFLLRARGIGPAELPGFDSLPVLDEPLLLALPEAHALAQAQALDPQAVAAEPLVIFPRSIAPSLHDAILAWTHRQGHAPAIAQEAIQMQTIVNLVSAGLGLAWVPASITTLQRPGVVYRRLDARHAPPQGLAEMVWPREAPAATRRFVEHVRAALAAAGLPPPGD